MDDALFGMETELAFASWKSGTEADEASREDRISELFELAGARLCSLPDEHSRGLYLENGSRLYLDAGLHPEFCTPECRSPEEAVRWQLADERILAELADELEKQHPETRVALFRCNVDYSGSGQTWGCHESYQHRCNTAQMRDHLVPHLVTRILYTGAGGFNNRQAHLEFLLSPRVPHLVHDAGADSQHVRSLYHTKNEPLGSGGFNRLHLLCGESNSSQLSTYLKLGTTALIVRLIDAGVCRGKELSFLNPRGAMLAYARDPACRVRKQLKSGRRLTAAQVQREYLRMVEKHLGADFMPGWASQVCQRWREVLDQLESDPKLLSTRLDWAIKHALFRDRLARSRSSWNRLRMATGPGAELCEIDTRFGELGARGLFRTLDHAGALDHQLPELGSVEEAMSSPPAGGRAEARGRAIQSLYSDRSRYRCTWERISDTSEERIYDMGDPFGRGARWRTAAIRRPRRSPNEERRLRVESQLHRGIDLYQRARLSRASAALVSVAGTARDISDAETEALARFWCATAYSDLGNLRSAETVLSPALQSVDRETSRDTACRVWTRYASILLDRPDERSRIEQAMERVRSSGSGDVGGSRKSLLEARFAGSLGQYAQAIECMEGALEQLRSDSIPFARGSYRRWLVSWLVRTSQIDRAESQLADWRNDPGRSLLHGDITLACAESVVARCRGNHAAALEHAKVAVLAADDSEQGLDPPDVSCSRLERAFDAGPPGGTQRSVERTRYLVTAYCALIESAVAVGDLETARPYVAELAEWGDLEIGEQRGDRFHAQAVFHQAVAIRGGARPDANEELRAAQALDAAAAEARKLDEQLETTHHVRERPQTRHPTG